MKLKKIAKLIVHHCFKTEGQINQPKANQSEFNSTKTIYENRLKHQVNQMRPHQTSIKLEVQTQHQTYSWTHIRIYSNCVQTNQQYWHRSESITWLTECYIIAMNLPRPTKPKSKASYQSKISNSDHVNHINQKLPEKIEK